MVRIDSCGGLWRTVDRKVEYLLLLCKDCGLVWAFRRGDERWTVIRLGLEVDGGRDD
jgi:hypothetical protein